MSRGSRILETSPCDSRGRAGCTGAPRVAPASWSLSPGGASTTASAMSPCRGVSCWGRRAVLEVRFGWKQASHGSLDDGAPQTFEDGRG